MHWKKIELSEKPFVYLNYGKGKTLNSGWNSQNGIKGWIRKLQYTEKKGVEERSRRERDLYRTYAIYSLYISHQYLMWHVT